jgi:cytoskeletal protein RodZ
MSNDFQSNSRSGYRAKRKKTNLILNSLIFLVLALIVFVAYSIFSGDDQAAPKKESANSGENQSVDKDKNQSGNKEDTTKEDNKTSPDGDGAVTDEEEGSEKESEETTAPAQPDESQTVVTEGGSTANVIKTIENPSWEPVGTTQTGEHTPVLDTESTDWSEMIKAMSYATGIEQDDMIVFWVTSDKTTSNSWIGTVHSKDKQKKYRVNIKWVDGKGWKPTKMEELAELEK